MSTTATQYHVLYLDVRYYTNPYATSFTYFLHFRITEVTLTVYMFC